MVLSAATQRAEAYPPFSQEMKFFSMLFFVALIFSLLASEYQFTIEKNLQIVVQRVSNHGIPARVGT